MYGTVLAEHQTVVDEKGGEMLQYEVDCRALARRATLVPFTLMAVFLFLATASQPAQSQTYKVIYNFTGIGTDGANPYAGPVLLKGNLYGTTYLGGSDGNGTVYRLSPSGSSWKHTSLYSFNGPPDGAGPGFGSLAIGPDGALFGTTEGGGYFGSDFEICSCKGKEVQIHQFGRGTDGAQPLGGVVLDSAGNFYGTANLGGTLGDGTVFEEKKSGNKWTEITLYNFTGGDDGINPEAGVTLDAHGNLYGTTSTGGADGDGVVYKLSRHGSGWKQTVLHTFHGKNDGANPVGGLVLDKAGNLYGGTFDGGVNGGGVVYELSPSAKGWKFTTLYSLTGGYGGPYNKLTLANGNIYGFTEAEGANGFGSVFKLAPGKGGWTFTDLYDFVGGSAGAQPYGSVVVDKDGNVFGTTNTGGAQNQGVVFEITP
jgi:uncharacterized repeat protein (TIGR03803 family)